MAKRVFELAKDLDVTSKAILDKCRAEGIELKNHMAVLSAGLVATIAEWFSESASATAVETSEHIDLTAAREEAKAERERRRHTASEVSAEGGVAVEETPEAGKSAAPAEPATAPAEAPVEVEVVAEQPAEAAPAAAAPEAVTAPVVPEAPAPAHEVKAAAAAPAAEEAPEAHPAPSKPTSVPPHGASRKRNPNRRPRSPRPARRWCRVRPSCKVRAWSVCRR